MSVLYNFKKNCNAILVLVRSTGKLHRIRFNYVAIKMSNRSARTGFDLFWPKRISGLSLETKIRRRSLKLSWRIDWRSQVPNIDLNHHFTILLLWSLALIWMNCRHRDSWVIFPLGLIQTCLVLMKYILCIIFHWLYTNKKWSMKKTCMY